MGTYPVAIAGETFRNADGSSRQEEIERCRVGEGVELLREPDNRFDPNCVRVISIRGVQIGNVDREAAEWVAERLDAGRPCRAVIRSIGDGGAGKLGVVLDMATDEAATRTRSQGPRAGGREESAPLPRTHGLGASPEGPRSKLTLWLVIGGVLLLVGMCSGGGDGPVNEQQKKEQVATEAKATEAKAAAEAERKRTGFHCLSSWDGSHRELVRSFKETLREPGSFEHIETRITPVNKKGAHVLLMRYRARNGFGGMNVGRVAATVRNADCSYELVAADE